MTDQIPEHLTWTGSDFSIWVEPLAPYITMTDIDLTPTDVLNSACWRGYVARWEINGDRLYLLDIDGISESAALSLAQMFPGFDHRVFAHWFTGAIIIPVDQQACGSSGSKVLPTTLWLHEGQVLETRNEECSGYLIPQLARTYKDYAPELSDLSERVTISEIEANAIVSDPMGAVPAVPFGHMNWKWEEFKAGMEPYDAVWHFARPWGGSHLHSGYATVVGNRVGSFILTSIG